jgi:D-alanyl-D-alanine carboxypeptidase
MVPNDAAITIEMLLNHTSGIFEYVEDADWFAAVLANPYRSWSPQELVAVGTAHPPLFAPGQAWRTATPPTSSWVWLWRR